MTGAAARAAHWSGISTVPPVLREPLLLRRLLRLARLGSLQMASDAEASASETLLRIRRAVVRLGSPLLTEELRRSEELVVAVGEVVLAVAAIARGKLQKGAYG